MQKVSFDPGLSQKFNGQIRRAINPDGSFNVHRKGVQNLHVYQYLLNISWPYFFALVLAAFIGVNIIFALIYLMIGIENLQGAEAGSIPDTFLSAFFFSVHTFTTVGYGSISPKGVLASAVAGFEALTGLMSFAIATGVLYGRFSKASAQINFSKNVLIAPYQDKTGLQFRIVNGRSNLLMEMDARVMLMTVEKNNGQLQRRYYDLPLERNHIYFFPLPWTIVHPIDENSQLYGKSQSDLEELQAEILILVKGFDETFSQTVYARYSYRHDEMIWGAKFVPAFHIDDLGNIILEPGRLNDIERVSLNG